MNPPAAADVDTIVHAAADVSWTASYAQLRASNVLGTEQLLLVLCGFMGLIALIAPHAGYPYSGSIAAHAFAHLKGSAIDTVILIGPSHYASFNGASVYARGGMRTPLGVVPINEKIARSLIDEKAGITLNAAAFDREHSLEVQLPFLQRTLKDFTIVPILIGTPTQESFAALSEKLAAVLRKNERAIVVASTDLSHYHNRATASAMDKKVIDAVERLSSRDLHSALMKLVLAAAPFIPFTASSFRLAAVLRGCVFLQPSR